MSTTTNLDTLKINYLTQAQYQTALDGGQINDNEIYLTPSSDCGGEVYTAAWIASASSSINYHLTDSISLPAGVYVVTITVPLASGAMLMSLSSGAPPYYTLDSLQEATQILVLPSAQSIYLQSSGSTSITYSYLERGGLKAVRISGLPFTTQADTIVEQGTSGDWNYRKWASGYLELDAIKTATVSFTNWGSLSYAEISLSALPFTVVSQYSTSVIAFSGSVSCWGGMMNSGVIRVYSQSGAGSNHSVTVSRQIRGTWK